MGLGKTYLALGVIKYFELRNHRVLVLCPKKLPENWTVYLAQNASELNPFIKDRFACTVLSHTDLSRESGKTGVKTKVMLLSATPVNNDLKALRNQLYLVSEGQDHAFMQSTGIASITQTLDSAQRLGQIHQPEKPRRSANGSGRYFRHERGKTVPFAALCALFDAETDHGQNIKAYSALLDQAVAAIVAQFARKNAANLFTGQGGKLMDAVKAVKGNSDFELITWLVIK